AASLAVAATVLPAHARRSFTVRVPTFEVPAGHNREICVFAPVPAEHAMDIGEVRIVNHGAAQSFASHHLIVYSYHRSLDGVKAGVPEDDTACLNFGSGRPSDLQIVATSQSPRSRQIMPSGTALRLQPETDPAGKPLVGLVLNSHWINGDSRPHRARAKITLITRKAKDLKRDPKPPLEEVPNGFL